MIKLRIKIKNIPVAFNFFIKMTIPKALHQHHHHRINKLSRLRLTLLLTGFGMVLEFVGGIFSNSLALISDAGHMLTHLFALGMSYLAIRLALRPATKKKTYGFYRAEVLAAFVNGIVLIFISAYIIYKAAARFVKPQEIEVVQMLFVAGIGLLINGVSTILLVKVSKDDLNVRSALLHEIGDMISSIAVVLGGFIIFWTGSFTIDAILSFFISILIVIWAVKLLIDSGNILLEAAPKHLDIDELTAVLKNEIKGVYEVHHVHAWTIASSMYALTAHVVIEDCHVSSANEILNKINNIVRDRFNVEHTNIQFECLIKK